MLKKSLTVVAVFLALIVLAFVAHRKLPPYELGVHSVEAHMSGATDGAPHIGSCPVFPADNIWNTPIDTLPKLPKSDVYIQSIGADKKMHADFGANLNYGIPYTEIPENTKPVPVSFEYADDSDPGPYPIPPNAPIEGGSDNSGDRHVILVDGRKCILYELYHAARQKDGSWSAGSGARMDLNSNALRGEGKTSADASGMAILPGLVRYDEVAAGEIRHALRFTLIHTRNTYVWPARHRASPSSDAKLPPMGTRFRLRANYDITEFSLNDRVIMKALKKYGMLLADNGSPMYLSGVSDKRWNNDDLHRLGDLTAADFEAVDESDLQVSSDSGKAKSR